MKKTIVYMGNFGFPDRNASGKRVLGNCLMFQSLGYRAVCIGPGDGSTLACEGVCCHTIAVGNTDRVLGNKWQEALNILERECENGNLYAVVLYGALFTQRENVSVVKWCKRNGVSVFYDHVDWFELNWHNPIRAVVRATNYLLQDKLVIPRCDGVICISNYLAEHHKNYGRRTVIIPPLSMEKLTACKKRPEDAPIRFVYAGTTTDVARPVAQWKDRLDIMFGALVDAVEPDGRSFVFDIYGLTGEQYIRMFPDDLRDAGRKVLAQLGDRVVFHGMTPNAQVMQAVSEADFTVLIRDRKRSTMAGFPTKVSESISCGTPVICTDTSDLRDYIRNGHNGFVCEIDELAEVYRAVLKMPDEELTAMKQACLENSFYYLNYTAGMCNFLEG